MGSIVSTVSYADIALFVILGLAVICGLIGGLAKAFRGFYISVITVLAALLLVGVTVSPIVGTSLGQKLVGVFEKQTSGWGEAFSSEVHIQRDKDGKPVMDGKNFTYYITVDRDGETVSVQLDKAAGEGLVDKAKSKLAIVLAQKFVNEENEGVALNSIAATALATLIFDIALFIIYCIVIAVLLSLVRKIFKKMHDSESSGVKLVDRLLGMIVSAAVALLFVWLVLAILRSAAGSTKAGEYLLNSPVVGVLYKNNPMFSIWNKIFG